MPLELTSTAFAHGGEISSEYSCEGRDISPPPEVSMRGHAVAQGELAGRYQGCE